MIFQLIIFLFFLDGSVSLVCIHSSPSNCKYNSTCEYREKECQRSESSHIRGGMYCSTIARRVNEEIIIGTMDCMYDQETTKSCKNQSQCTMKSTRKDQSYLHCCCDQSLCNLNFQISNHSEIDSIPSQLSPSTRRCLSLNSISILIITIVSILLILLVCLLSRRCLIRSWNKLWKVMEKQQCPEKLDGNEEKELILEKNVFDQIIPIEHIQMGNQLKRGRFARIHQGAYNGMTCAIKIFDESSSYNESKKLFVNEKEIYSAPFMQHSNILKYYGYSLDVSSSYLLIELSTNGSLRDVLHSRFLHDENELQFLCREISSGLEYLHRDFRSNNYSSQRPPIAHRDFKSDNILYINDQKVVICDFAMSIQLDQNQNFPNEQQQIGTPRYMSPELLSGTIGYETNALLKCDVYALGIVFWEILSRYPLKDHQSIPSMPFEDQLRSHQLNLTPSIGEMLQIIHLPSPFNRPLLDPIWKDQSLSRLICSTMEECWDQNPEGRINSALVALRMHKK